MERNRQRRQRVVGTFVSPGPAPNPVSLSSPSKKHSGKQPRPNIYVSPRGIGPVIDPNDNDVLCGRGGRINAHPGNVQFRYLIQARKKDYLAKETRKLAKAHIAAQVVHHIRDMEPSGRFLKEDADGRWFDIGDAKAIKKVGQALREDAIDFREDDEKLSDQNPWPGATKLGAKRKFEETVVPNNANPPGQSYNQQQQYTSAQHPTDTSRFTGNDNQQALGDRSTAATSSTPPPTSPLIQPHSTTPMGQLYNNNQAFGRPFHHPASIFPVTPTVPGRTLNNAGSSYFLSSPPLHSQPTPVLTTEAPRLTGFSNPSMLFQLSSSSVTSDPHLQSLSRQQQQSRPTTETASPGMAERNTTGRAAVREGNQVHHLQVPTWAGTTSLQQQSFAANTEYSRMLLASAGLNTTNSLLATAAAAASTLMPQRPEVGAAVPPSVTIQTPNPTEQSKASLWSGPQGSQGWSDANHDTRVTTDQNGLVTTSQEQQTNGITGGDQHDHHLGMFHAREQHHLNHDLNSVLLADDDTFPSMAASVLSDLSENLLTLDLAEPRLLDQI